MDEWRQVDGRVVRDAPADDTTPDQVGRLDDHHDFAVGCSGNRIAGNRSPRHVWRHR